MTSKEEIKRLCKEHIKDLKEQGRQQKILQLAHEELAQFPQGWYHGTYTVAIPHREEKPIPEVGSTVWLEMKDSPIAHEIRVRAITAVGPLTMIIGAPLGCRVDPEADL